MERVGMRIRYKFWIRNVKFQLIMKHQVLNFQSKHKVTSPRKHHL